LQREQANEQYGYAVEQRPVVALKRGVQHVADDLWKREPHARRYDQANRRYRETPRVWAEQRNEPA